MSTAALWTFLAYMTQSGSRVVQEWFDLQADDFKDEARDTMRYLEMLPNHLWKRPGFDSLGDEGISEIRIRCKAGVFRMYGDWGPNRHEYTILVGADKKESNQRRAKKLAKDRKKELSRGDAGIHALRWKEDTD